MTNRKPHIFELNIEKKHCPTCNTYKILSDFTKQSSSWDNLARMCRCCFNEYKQNKRKNDENYIKKEKEYREEYEKSGRRKETNQKRYQEKKEEILAKCVEYNKKRYNEDPLFKIIHLQRTRIGKMMRDLKLNKKVAYKKSKLELLGCTGEELKIWIEIGTNGIHIDHIKPICAFDLSSEEEQKRCFHFTNLQPLWAEDNLSKGGNF
jgi:hypothetical protein